MTVRAWFTISALVLAALAAAFIFRLFAPVPAPEIIVRAGDERLGGMLVRACWPQRTGEIECRDEPDRSDDIRRERIPSSGDLQISIAYPAPPESGSLTITTEPSDRVVLTRDWTSTLSYDLEPGSYVLRAVARYPEEASVTYDFLFSVIRSGS